MSDMRCKTWLNVDEVRRRVEGGTAARVAQCAGLIEAEAKQLLSRGSKQMGMAQFGDKKTPIEYQSSAPGQPPFLRSGNLRDSIASAKSGPQSYVVGPTAKGWYGRVHEFGACIMVTPKMRGFLAWAFGWHLSQRTGVIQIPPRPFMRPALDHSVAQFPELFRDLPIGGPVEP